MEYDGSFCKSVSDNKLSLKNADLYMLSKQEEEGLRSRSHCGCVFLINCKLVALGKPKLLLLAKKNH